MNQWMTDSQKLVNSLHVEMDPKEVTGTVQQIKVGLLCTSISKKRLRPWKPFVFFI